MPASGRIIGIGVGSMLVEGNPGSRCVLVNPADNMQLGVNPAALDLIDFIKRRSDALADPRIGQFSDHFRFRWGRQPPLMAAALLPRSLLYGALWWFPAGA